MANCFQAIIASCFVVATTVAADVSAPVPFPMERYVAMSEKSPFALATPPVAGETPQASFASNWFIGGIAKVGDVDFVTIKSRDLTTQFALFGRESVEGVSLASVNWSDAIGQTTVILRKGTETAKLEFNEMQLRSAPAATPPATAGGPTALPPRVTPRSGGTIISPERTVNPSTATPANQAPIIIPSTGLPTSATAQQQSPTNVQRRIRIINQPR